MGTRHLTCVKKDNEYKVAQYGQWNGNPEGQGTTIVEFFNNDLFKLIILKKQIDKTKFLTDKEWEDFEKIMEDKSERLGKDWQELYPELSRDTGAGVLDIIYNNPNERIVLSNSIDFANDNTFCEWVYIIDLDNDTLGVYDNCVYGIDKIPTPKVNMVINLETNETCSMTLIKEFDIKNLPTPEEFVEFFNLLNNVDED